MVDDRTDEKFGLVDEAVAAYLELQQAQLERWKNPLDLESEDTNWREKVKKEAQPEQPIEEPKFPVIPIHGEELHHSSLGDDNDGPTTPYEEAFSDWVLRLERKVGLNNTTRRSGGYALGPDVLEKYVDPDWLDANPRPGRSPVTR